MKKKQREHYVSMVITIADFTANPRFLCGSIMGKTTVEATGQAIEPENDFSNPLALPDNEGFNHDWE